MTTDVSEYLIIIRVLILLILHDIDKCCCYCATNENQTR